MWLSMSRPQRPGVMRLDRWLGMARLDGWPFGGTGLDMLRPGMVRLGDHRFAYPGFRRHRFDRLRTLVNRPDRFRFYDHRSNRVRFYDYRSNRVRFYDYRSDRVRFYDYRSDRVRFYDYRPYLPPGRPMIAMVVHTSGDDKTQYKRQYD